MPVLAENLVVTGAAPQETVYTWAMAVRSGASVELQAVLLPLEATFGVDAQVQWSSDTQNWTLLQSWAGLLDGSTSTSVDNVVDGYIRVAFNTSADVQPSIILRLVVNLVDLRPNQELPQLAAPSGLPGRGKQ